MGEDQGELADSVGRKRLQVEVLDDEDAVLDIENLRDAERPVGVLGRNRPVAPSVTSGQRDIAVGQPLRDLAARSRLTGQVGLGVFPVAAPAGVKQNRVAGLRVDPRTILRPDHAAGVET